MASGKVDAYNLGEMGVNIVDAPTHQKDVTLAQAQNAMSLPSGGALALQKRYGMSKLTAIPANGQIYSFFQIPVVDPDPNAQDFSVQWGPDGQPFKGSSGLDTGTQRFWGPRGGPAEFVGTITITPFTGGFSSGFGFG